VDGLIAVDEIGANFDDLAAGYEAFGSVVASVRSTLAGLDSELRGSLGCWDGAAAEAYWAAHERWWQAADDMTAWLVALQKVIKIAHGNYANAVNANARIWGPR